MESFHLRQCPVYKSSTAPRFHAMPCCFVVTTEVFSPRSQIDDNKLCRCQTTPTPHETLPISVWTRRSISRSDEMPYRKPTSRYFTMTTGSMGVRLYFCCKAGLFPRTRTTDPAPPPAFAENAAVASDPRSLPCASPAASNHLRLFSYYSIPRGLLGVFVNSSKVPQTDNHIHEKADRVSSQN